MLKLAIFLMFGGLLGGFAPTPVYGQELYGPDLAHAPKPAKTRMVFMGDNGAAIVLSVSRRTGVMILEGPADDVALVRDALVQSGLPSNTIVTCTVDLRRAKDNDAKAP